MKLTNMYDEDRGAGHGCPAGRSGWRSVGVGGRSVPHSASRTKCGPNIALDAHDIRNPKSENHDHKITLLLLGQTQ